MFYHIGNESRDISTKEEMASILCYVKHKAGWFERFFGVFIDIKAVILEAAIEAIPAKHGLCVSRLHG